MADVAAMFGMSRSTAYRAVRARKAAPKPDTDPRLVELRSRKGPPVVEVIEGERVTMTPRAQEALHAAHAKIAAGWRVLQDDRAAMERERDDFLRRVRVRVAKSDGPWQPATFSLLRGPLRYSIAAVTFGPRAAPPAVSVELPPWPLPWEPIHPTEAVGQLFRNAMRGKPLPTAAVALGMIDRAMDTLTAFRGMLTEPAQAATGPPQPEIPEPDIELPDLPKSPGLYRPKMLD